MQATAQSSAALRQGAFKQGARPARPARRSVVRCQAVNVKQAAAAAAAAVALLVVSWLWVVGFWKAAGVTRAGVGCGNERCTAGHLQRTDSQQHQAEGASKGSHCCLAT